MTQDFFSLDSLKTSQKKWENVYVNVFDYTRHWNSWTKLNE